MNIVFLLPRFVNSQSGGYKMIYEYANYLANRGYNVSLLYLNENALKRYHMPEFVRKTIINNMTKLGPRWFNLDKSILKISTEKKYYQTKLKRIDIAIFTAIETIKYVDVFKDTHKIYFIQDFENWNFDNEEVYKSYNLGMVNIVVAKWLKEIVDKYSKEPSYIVSNCIDNKIFFNKGMERRKHSLVFHYRSSDYKGPQYAIMVINELYHRYKDLIVNVISTEKKPSNLPECCRFYRGISAEKIADINNTAQVFMCTSIEEGFGLPGLEAMACGCALVSSSYKGVFEYAVDGVNALLSPTKDVKSMVDNIVNLFENDEVRIRISQNGIETGREKSLELSAKKFESILLRK